MPREENKLADSLAILASVIVISPKIEMVQLTIEIRHKSSLYLVIEREDDEEPWYTDI